MGGPNKLLLPVSGRPMVAHATEALIASGASTVVVVTGRDGDAVWQAVEAVTPGGCDVQRRHNQRHEAGYGGSLGVGFQALAEDEAQADGALVMLADMPDVAAQHLHALIVAFKTNEGRAIIRAAHGAVPGNPVIIPRALFAAMAGLQGEGGGRAVLAASGLSERLVDIGPVALQDIDDPATYRRRTSQSDRPTD